MKVLFLSHLYPSGDRPAYGIFVHEQARALVEQGVDIRVIAPTRRRLSPDDGRWQGIPVVRPRYFLFPRNYLFHWAGQLMYRGIRRAVRKLYRTFPFDLIHAHAALPEGYAALLLGREMDVPVAVTVHGRDLQDTVNRGPRCAAALKWVFEGADIVMTVSDKLRKLAAAHRLGDASNVVTVYNGVDLSRTVKAPPESLVRRYRGRRVLLSVCNLYRTKGVDLNLRALSRLAPRYFDLLYLVVGGGPERRRLENMAVRLKISDRVEFLGPLPHSSAMEHMACCHLFSLPSWREGFGVVYLEAAAHGRPLIACRGEGIAEVFRHGKEALLVEPRQVDDLARALSFLLDNPEEAGIMGERARRKVQEELRWESNARAVKELYQCVLHK